MSDSGRPGGLEALLADGLAELVNRSLDLDPGSAARLATLEGHRVRLTATFPGPVGERDLTLTVRGARLRLLAGREPDPHVIVHGAAADVATWLLGAEPGAGLRIDGDSAVLQEVTALLRDFRPDLGGPLAALVGEDAARSALGTAELALAGVRSLLQGASHGVRNGAAQRFLDRAGLERLLEETEELRLRLDRLDARVSAEERRRTSP